MATQMDPAAQMAPPSAPGEEGGGGLLNRERLAQLGPLIALLLVCIFFTTQSDRFLSGQNFSLIFQQVMVIGTLAIGQTLIILTAGIDLACGAIMAFGAIVMTKLATDSGVPPLLALLVGILACAAFGALHGGLVTRLGLPPFIGPLGTANVPFALTHIYSKDETISDLPSLFTALGNSFKIGSTAIPYGSLLCLGLFVGAWFVLSQTTWGRRVFALGDAPEATRLMGINVKRQLTMVYVVAGVIYGIAALLLVCRTSVG